MRIDGEPVSGALFDFTVYLARNHEGLARNGTGPYFYLPKLESHLEARLWSEVFATAETALGITRGTIKATVLIETLPAAFEMDEILYELREHAAGLNAGRWDYIFSFIKKFRADPASAMHDKAFDRAKTVVAYCASGGRSALVGKTLKDMGMSNVAHIDGGFTEWVKQGAPVETYEAHRARRPAKKA